MTLIANELQANLPDPPVYIYPVPSQHRCSGTVVAIQYCYQLSTSGDGGQTVIFNSLKIMNILEGGMTFEVVNSVPIQSTAMDHTCVRNDIPTMCCETLDLSGSDQFEIPSTAFAYSVEVDTTSDIQLLAFSGSAASYQVDGFIIPFSMGDEFTVTSGSAFTSGLVLLKFLIGTCIIIQWSSFYISQTLAMEI